MSKFPKIENGSCDGLGCGGILCWCNEYVAMKEEFQEVFDKAWDERSRFRGQDPDCIAWEKSWRFGTERFGEYYKQELDDAKKRYLIGMETASTIQAKAYDEMVERFGKIIKDLK